MFRLLGCSAVRLFGCSAELAELTEPAGRLRGGSPSPEVPRLQSGGFVRCRG